MTRIEIVSHPLCPMSQRLALTALLGEARPGEDFHVLHLAYPTLREEAGRHSETGDLPVLKLDGRAASTATDHAAEYLDARFGAGLVPEGAEARLAARTAERLVSASLDSLRLVFTARDAAALDAAYDGFFALIARAEAALPAFAPGALDRMDLVALAPMASLTGGFPALRDHAGWALAPRIKAHLDACRTDASVQASRCPGYDAEFDAFFVMTGSAFPSLAASR